MDFDALKAALAPLNKIGKDEFSFTIEGVEVTLRPLLPREEVAVQKFSASILDQAQEEEGASPEDNMTRATALDYFDRFRIEVVSHAICQINDQDFRGVDSIPTGEVLDNGVAVKLPRHIAMRDIITAQWSRSMITICFARYGDLVTKLAAAAETVAQSTIPDLDIEIERTQDRLGALKGERGRRTQGDPGIMQSQVEQLVSAGEEMQADVDRAVEAAAAATVSHIPVETASEESGVFMEDGPMKGIPQEAPIIAPPPVENVPPPVESAPPRRESVIPEQSPPPISPPPISPQTASSFADAEEPGVVEAEHARILEARRRAAASLSEAAEDAPHTPQDLLAGATPAGQVGGVDVYRLPAQTLSPRGRDKEEGGKKPNKKVKVNPRQGGELNPNFKKST